MNEYYEEKMSAKECFGWNNLKELTVDIFGANGIADEKKMGDYVNSHITHHLEKNNNYKSYVVLFKVFNHELLRKDHYRKIWKSDFIVDYDSQLENKKEIYSENDCFKTYLGIAEIKNFRNFDYYKFINKYPSNAAVFFSLNEYPLEMIESIMFSGSKKTPVINYQKLCEQLCPNGDTVLRLGIDEAGHELELIYDSNKLFQNMVYQVDRT